MLNNLMHPTLPKYSRQVSDHHPPGYNHIKPFYGQEPMVLPVFTPIDMEERPEHEHFNKGGLSIKDNCFVIPTGDTSLSKSGDQKLDEVLALYIKQKVNKMGLFSGCKAENSYLINAFHPKMHKKGHLIFKGKEVSGSFKRKCLSSNCRSFEMTIYNITGTTEDHDNELFLTLERPCQCACFGFNRAPIYVNLMESGRNEYLGKIEEKYGFCDVKLAVFDRDHALKYTIGGSSCQTGIVCMNTCESCQGVNFELKDKNGEILSNIHKSTSPCIGKKGEDDNSLMLEFPKGSSSDDKALLMSAVLFADWKYFETNSN